MGKEMTSVMFVLNVTGRLMPPTVFFIRSKTRSLKNTLFVKFVSEFVYFFMF